MSNLLTHHDISWRHCATGLNTSQTIRSTFKQSSRLKCQCPFLRHLNKVYFLPVHSFFSLCVYTHTYVIFTHAQKLTHTYIHDAIHRWYFRLFFLLFPVCELAFSSLSFFILSNCRVLIDFVI